MNESRGFKETQTSAFVVSRRIGRSLLSREIGYALAEFALPILTASTAQRVIYAEAMTAGRTVIEEQPDGPATDEVRAILAELEGTPA